jgi:hypothetical protein
VKNLNEVDALAELLKARFDHVAVRHDYGWPGNAALCILDCVLSLNRRYDKVVYPRVLAFSQRYPEVVELTHLQELLDQYPQVGGFCSERLNYNDIRREKTLRGVVEHLLAVQAGHTGESEWERLQAWAASVHPSDHKIVAVRGFGLSGFQYMRMLLGVQTTKPDVHVIRFVSKAVGHKVNDVAALTLLEDAAEKAGLPLREVDGAIWNTGARKQAVTAGSHRPNRRTIVQSSGGCAEQNGRSTCRRRLIRNVRREEAA